MLEQKHLINKKTLFRFQSLNQMNSYSPSIYLYIYISIYLYIYIFFFVLFFFLPLFSNLPHQHTHTYLYTYIPIHTSTIASIPFPFLPVEPRQTVFPQVHKLRHHLRSLGLKSGGQSGRLHIHNALHQNQRIRS